MKRAGRGVRLGTVAALMLLAVPPAAATPAAAASPAGPVTLTKDVVRTTVTPDPNDPTKAVTTTVDERHVSLTVSQTANLRGRQQLDVSWTGAHPTGGIVGDVHSKDAASQEYPFVLLQCRGTADAISPSTCWTNSADERFQAAASVGGNYPAWRSDRYAPVDQRRLKVDVPDPLPADCPTASKYAQRWVHFVAVDGTDYPGGDASCHARAPETTDVEGSGPPPNTTYGVTDLAGNGSARFTVWTGDENASLGCSATVACALVAVPIEGVSCDPNGLTLTADQRASIGWTNVTAAGTRCPGTDRYAPGARSDGNALDANTASTGLLWWSASNWDQRLTIPLHFAVSASTCAVVNHDTPELIYGSVLMVETTQQWRPKFCTDPTLFPFTHVQAADGLARTLVSGGSISGAFTSLPPAGGFTGPVVQAPVAITGFAIAYNIDSANPDDPTTPGPPYTKLRLNARLIAKLLTQSYPALQVVHDNVAALRDNPLNLSRDPEFVALNPGVASSGFATSATLQSLNADADLMTALTSYLNADPEARAFLDGTPDPWGMRINPAYQGIHLPVSRWTLLDTFQSSDSPNTCYNYAPAPWLSLTASPAATVGPVEENLQYGRSNSLIRCDNPDPSDPSTLRLRPEQTEGHNWVLGLVPLSAVGRYGLQAAALQTDSNFVRPDEAGLKAGAALLKADAQSRTWRLDYSLLHTRSGSDAYPGTMPVYLDVPTAGLSAQSASRMATLIRYAAGPGQVSGTANGQLPPGLLPLTNANGLGALRDYALRAAAAVESQQGRVPSLDPADDAVEDPAPPSVPPTSTPPTPVVSPTPSPSVPEPTGPTGDTQRPPVSSAPLPVRTSAPGLSTGTAEPPRAATGSQPASVPAPPVRAGGPAMRTVAETSTLGRVGLPVVVIGGLVAGLLGGALRWNGRRA